MIDLNQVRTSSNERHLNPLLRETSNRQAWQCIPYALYFRGTGRKMMRSRPPWIDHAPGHPGLHCKTLFQEIPGPGIQLSNSGL